MKTKNVISIVFLSVTIFFIACDTDNVDYAQINFEKSKINESLLLTKSYNDSLKLVYDTAKTKLNNALCLKYDKLYHYNDSMFTVHYTMFGDMMYGYGMRMNNYTPNAGMMQNGMGMMNRNMDMTRIMGDTATVGGHYRMMNIIHNQHQITHNGIY